MLILVFLIPSIWSAVVLVKQTNFEKRAVDFVENYRSVENSVIYDYKIEHQDGSVLKIFLTGETLSTSARGNLYASAKECGIKEEQLIIKEYITKNSQESEAVFKGIYERLDSQIDKYELTIAQLNAELQAAKKNDLPYEQLASEIAATYPSVKHLYLGQGANVTLDSLKVTHTLLVKVQTDTLLPAVSVEQLKNWIKVRLQVERVEVENTIY